MNDRKESVSPVSVLELKYCDFIIECYKVMIEIMSCNFGLKSYLFMF